VAVEFNAAGAKKMRSATEKHIGKPVGIIIDGQVVTPVLRTAISGSAVVSGNFTRAQAERIAKGIGDSLKSCSLVECRPG
jgi:preprotein translocase subunit SecD